MFPPARNNLEKWSEAPGAAMHPKLMISVELAVGSVEPRAVVAKLLQSAMRGCPLRLDCRAVGVDSAARRRHGIATPLLLQVA